MFLLLKMQYQNQRSATSSVWGRDSNHGLYSLGSRLGLDIKNSYPDTLRAHIFTKCIFTKRVKATIKTPLICRCDLKTYSQFGLINKATGKEAFACSHCLNDLVTHENRHMMLSYNELKAERKTFRGQPLDEELLKQKMKLMTKIAYFFKVINEDERSILLDDACNHPRKNSLQKTVQLFFLCGNGFDNPKEEVTQKESGEESPKKE